MSASKHQRSITGEWPAIPGSDEELDAASEACEHEREEMTPRQTADCAGADIAQAYENEEDGGS